MRSMPLSLVLALVLVVHVCAGIHREAGSVPPTALPSVIGVIGVGTIGSATVRGLLSSPAGALPFVPDFVLSPRDAKKAAALKAAFPAKVRIAANDQEVVDSCDCAVLALPGSVAESVLATLRFRQDQQVVSLIGALKYERLRQLLGVGVDCTRALPLPAIAKRQGATLGFPARPFAEAIFSAMGSYIAAATDEDFMRLEAAGAFMGDFYQRQLTIQQWLVARGTDPAVASAYIGSQFATYAADSAEAGPDTFQQLVAEQTPGGYNDMVMKGQEVAGAYAAVNQSLEAVYSRIVAPAEMGGASVLV